MTLDLTQVFVKAVKEVESQVHEKGWDKPAHLFCCNLVPEGLMVESYPIFDMGRVADTSPVDTLAYIASDDHEVDLPNMWLGWIFVAESWALEGSKEDCENLPEGKSLADVPGAVECRTVVATYSAGVVTVYRVRGREPKVEAFTDLPPEFLDSRVGYAMSRLMVKSIKNLMNSQGSGEFHV